jgi:hypothetical protein
LAKQEGIKFPKTTKLFQEDISKFLAVHGEKGIRTLSVLGSKQDLEQALKSEVGRFVLTTIMTKMEFLSRQMDKKIAEYKKYHNEMTAYNTLKDLFLELLEPIRSSEVLRKRIKNGGTKNVRKRSSKP